MCLQSIFAQEIEYNHSIHHSFIENKGQWKEDVLFKSKFDGGNLWVEQHKMMFHLQDFSVLHEAHVSKKSMPETRQIPQTVVHLNFIGSNKVEEIEKRLPTKSYYNYFLGNNKDKWASNVRGFGEAILKELYDGIDLKIIEQQEQLKYEFHVQPDADVHQIVLEYVGQEKIFVNRKGDLVVKTVLGEIIEQKPYAYQIINGRIKEVKCDFVVEGDKVTFELGKYSSFAQLIIDPVLVFATYSGSVTDNFGMTATYGYDGTAYSGGMIYGNAYPTPDPNAYNTTSNFTVASNTTYGITDAFISKYSADGTTMLWTTFIGGGDDTQGTETAQSMICDKYNNIYLYGATSSTDFPIQGGYQSAFAGGLNGTNFLFNGVYFTNNGTDIFVVKISENGQNLMGSTYLGGSSDDGVNYKPASLPYNNISLYDSLTANYGDQFRGEIMLDSVGNCIVASCTRSTDFPVLNAFQPMNAGSQDGVVFKLSSDLSTLQWSSYYGGSTLDACYSVKIDSSYNIVVAGGTASSDLPGTSGGWQTTYNGGMADGFVVKITGDGSSIINASYIGTTNYDQAFFVEIDRADNVYLVGQSNGGAFPVINSPFVNPGSSQFVLKLAPDLLTPLNSTVFGSGSSTFDISPSAFLVDICGNIYISGWGGNILPGGSLMNNMPISANAFQSSPPNGHDFYLMVIERDFTGLLYGSYLGGASAGEHVDGGTSRFDKNGIVYQSVCGGCGGYSDFPTSSGAWSNQNLSTNCNNLVFKFDFELIPKAEFTIDNNMGCKPFTVTFDNFSSASDSYLWDFGNGDTTSVIFEPVITYDTVGVFQVYLYVTDSICLLTDTAEITITVFDSLELSTSPNVSLCNPVPITMTAFSNSSASTFIWSSNINFTDTLNPNISDSIFTTTPPGAMTYYVQVSNAGCSLIDSIEVEITSSALLLTGNDSICAGDQTTITASSTNPLITFDNFVWTPDSILVSPSSTNSVTVHPTTSQFLYLAATSNTGCVAFDSILINVGNIPQSIVSASASEYTVPQGAEVVLTGQPSSGYSYSWEPNNLVYSPVESTTAAIVNQTTLYTFFVTDGVCTRSDTVLVKAYEFVCGDSYLYVPNAFTPNGDGENDVLYVRGPAIKDMIFRVYDRWGELVFESFERPYGWDGTYKGKLLQPDVYDYYLKVTCIDDVETIVKGNVTLLR